MKLFELAYSDIPEHKIKIIKKKNKYKLKLDNTGVNYSELKAPNFAQRDRQEDDSIE